MVAFLFCRNCRVVHHVFSAHELTAGGPVSEAAAIAYGQFLVDHRHHWLERLDRTGRLEHIEGTRWDPARIRFIEVGNGREVFTLRSARDGIDEPLRYELVDQRIEPGAIQLTVDEAIVRRAIDRHFFPYVLRSSRIDHFVQAVRDVLAMLSGEQLDTAFDDADDPAVSIAALPDESCAALLDRCVAVFDTSELPRVASFVMRNRDEYGALAVRVCRETSVSTPLFEVLSAVR